MNVENGKTYVGVVEDNNDPKKMGRVKIRVLDVFDDTPLADIPWANPWKDLVGDQFTLPDNGKIVTVVFENANINNPEFIFSDHYNANLEKKLEGLGEADYLSMKTIIFDHKTQIYVNDGEGLKLDHKFNIINIKETSIDVNLKDNFGKINLGTANSTQRIILGDNFLNWFDDFVGILMGGKGGPFLGNLGAPVIPTPALLGSIQLYKQLKDPKFLSKNVYAVDNENVDKLDRISEGQKGDTWVSTIKENETTSKEPIPYTSTAGASDTTFEQPETNATSGTQSTTAKQPDPKPNPKQHPDIDGIIELMNIKNYELYEDVYKLNIVAIRNQCQSIGDKYTDQFVDKLYVMFKKEDGAWELKQYMFSTVPGLEFTITDNWLKEKNLSKLNPWIGSSGKKITMKEYAKTTGTINGDPNLKDGLPILAPSQYIDVYYLSEYRGAKAFLTIPGATQLIFRDNDTDNFDTFNPHNFTKPELITPNILIDNGIKVHLGYPGGKNVGNWSEGSQVFSNKESLNEFFGYCEKHREKYDNKFTYTLANKNDWDEAIKNVGADKSANTLSPTQSKVDNSATQSETGQSVNTNSATQSTSQEIIESNKSGVIDVFNDGTLIIDVYIPDIFADGKVTIDEIKSIEQTGHIKISIKSQSIPNEWQFVEGNALLNTPIGDGSVLFDLNSTESNYTIYSDQFKEIGDDNIFGSYKLSISISMNKKSNNEKKDIQKDIQFSIEKGSSASNNQSSISSKSIILPQEYIIGILNPTTDASKKITGKVTVENSGNEYMATGLLSGLPDGSSVGPISGPFSSIQSATNENVDNIADNMLFILEDYMLKNYQFLIKLVILDKK